jgi:sulfur carrier protein ThiS adenylyltransferase
MTFEQIRTHVKNFTVGIAGCGGLGSNCAVALARTGIGKLVIADYDVVQESNLNRQYFFHDQTGRKKVLALEENLRRIRPGIDVEPHFVKLDEQNIPVIFADCHVIVEAFDLADMKQMIIETVLKEMPDKFIVSGVGLAGYGNCDRFKKMESGKLIVCGDMETEVSEEMPPLAPGVAIVANMEADAVIQLIMNSE